ILKTGGVDQVTPKMLDLKNAIHVGHSTGGGEVTRYVGRHGPGRVAKAVPIGAIPPVMVKKTSNPGGTPIEEFDKLRGRCWRTGPNSGRTSVCRSTATTGRVPRSPKACGNRSGSRG